MAEPAASSTRDEILATALQLFTVQGYDATSLRQIADRLGFTMAALYYHFPAKEHLVIELARPWLEQISRLVTLSQNGDLGEAGTDECRAAVLSAYVDTMSEHHALLRFLSQDIAALTHPDVGKRARALVFALHDVVAGPDANDADRVRVACAFGAVHALPTLDPSTLTASRPIVIDVGLAALGITQQR